MTNRPAVCAIVLAASAALADTSAALADTSAALADTSAALAEMPEAADALVAQPLTTLDGESGTIALDPVRGGVLVLGFSRESTAQARQWSAQLRTAGQGNPGVPIYDVVGLVGAPRFVRGVVRRGIRSGVPEEDRGTFFIIEEDDAFWRTLAAVDDDKPAYVLRLNANGVVCARHVGPATDKVVARILGARCDEAGDAP